MVRMLLARIFGLFRSRKAGGRVMDYATLLQILDSTLRLATPLLLACLAGLFSERAGIFDIGLEGKMLVAAMCVRRGGLPDRARSGSGFCAGIAGSLVFALIHGVASITFRGNQLISGVALNFLASGITVLIAQTPVRSGRPHPAARRRGPVQPDRPCPLPKRCAGVPVLGPFYAEVISGHSILVYVALAAGARCPGGCSTAPALACACARWAKTRPRSIPRASRSCGCAMRPW